MPLCNTYNQKYCYDRTCRTCAHRARYNLDIPTLRNFIDDYLPRTSTLLYKYNASHSLIVILLPVEVLSFIFELCLPVDYSHQRQPNGVHPALVLGAVCRWWRSVAWNTHKLWTFVTIKFDHKRLSSLMVNFYARWFKRSGQLPLTIIILCKFLENPPAENMQLILALFDVINSQSHRWKRLETSLPPELYTHLRGSQAVLSPSSLTTTLPKLEYLKLCGPHNILGIPNCDKYDGAFFNVGNNLPRLTRLNISHLYMRDIYIDWSNVTHLEAGQFHLEETLEVLRHAQRLRICDVRVCYGSSDTFEIPSSPIINPHLQLFKCILEEHVESDDFFDAITLPALTFLDVDVCSCDFPVNSFVIFLQRSQCNISDLHIVRAWIETNDLIQVLRNVPSAKRLTLKTGYKREVYYFTDEFIQYLAVTSIAPAVKDGAADNRFLPNLETLYSSGRISHTWPMLPYLIYYQPPIVNAASDSVTPNPTWRRPLRSLTMNFITNPPDHVYPEPNQVEQKRPDMNTIAHLFHVSRNTGCEIALFDETPSMVFFKTESVDSLWAEKRRRKKGKVGGDTKSKSLEYPFKSTFLDPLEEFEDAEDEGD